MVYTIQYNSNDGYTYCLKDKGSVRPPGPKSHIRWVWVIGEADNSFTRYETMEEARAMAKKLQNAASWPLSVVEV